MIWSSGSSPCPWRPGTWQTEVLVSDEIVLVARSDHPLADGRALEAGDLDGLPFVAFEPGTAIRQHIDAALHDAAVHIDVVMELRSIPTILRMVSVTGNLAFVSRVSVATEPGLKVLEPRGIVDRSDARPGHPTRDAAFGARPRRSGLSC